MSLPPAAPLRAELYRSLRARARIVRRVARIAVEAGAPPYLVGGPVRDLILGQPVLDVDLLLPGQLAPVAYAAGKELGARVVVHSRFLTARIEVPGLRIDLSQARRERYPSPGALPVVRPASVAEDLGRRDFTIHAMALPLDRTAGEVLLDPFDGLDDLRRKRVRTLHERSFRDDPTRMFRAARYAARLGLELTAATRQQLLGASARRALARVSGERILHELERLLEEPVPSRAARKTHRWGLLGGVGRGWSLAPSAAAALLRFGECRLEPPWPQAGRFEVLRSCGLAILLLGAPGSVRRHTLERLGVRGRTAREIDVALDRLTRLQRALPRTRRLASVDAALSESTDVGLLLLFCSAPGRTAEIVRRYACELREFPPPLDGHAARRLGAVGPEIGELLRTARRRALDGGPVDEEWARSWLARWRG